MTEQESELLELHQRARDHLNSLVVAGVDDRAATIATMVACIERMVAAGGNAATSHYLRAMAVKIDKGELQSA
jgi:hypothetical protein